MHRTKVQRLTTLFGAAALLGASACASPDPSYQLSEARRAYQEAERSAAAEYVPDQLMAARQMLERAEQAHIDDAQSPRERHFAYLAERYAQIAMAQGNVAEAQRMHQQAIRQLRERDPQAMVRTEEQFREMKGSYAQLEQELQQNRQEIERLRGMLDDELQREDVAGRLDELEQVRGELEEQRVDLERQLAEKEQALESERQAREEAEERAEQVEQRLADLDDEPQKLTLSGAVLFEIGESDLMPLAERKLQPVAEALKQQEDAEFVIEGHTDSTGSVALNDRLSQERAEAVKDFLVQQGVPEDRIRAVGRGQHQPIASNASPDGRAMNRRVEIIMQNGATQRVRGEDRDLEQQRGVEHDDEDPEDN